MKKVVYSRSNIFFRDDTFSWRSVIEFFEDGDGDDGDDASFNDVLVLLVAVVAVVAVIVEARNVVVSVVVARF